MKHQLLTAFVMVSSMLFVQQARAELIAAPKEGNTVYLAPLGNGLAALTLVWTMDNPSKERVNELTAGLASVVTGGTSSRSSQQINAFLSLKGIRQSIRRNGPNLFLTVSAPAEVFPETLVHLENVLLEPEYSKGWYARELEKLEPHLASKTGRPLHVLSEVAPFLNFPSDTQAAEAGDHVFRFGHPTQAILRSDDEEIRRRTSQLIEKLPKSEATLGGAFSKWVTRLTGEGNAPFALPKGVIHFADPSSTEMLIFFAKAEEFADEEHHIGANLLVDYVGANQGSEMFRIIRQELRAAYDPRTEFTVLDRNKAVLSLSATVAAEKWLEVHARMAEIYESTRSGNIERAGLDIQYDILNRKFLHSFFTDPVWGVRHYLNEYPEGVVGSFHFALFQALETAPLDKILSNSDTYLPPLDDYLLVLIGGGEAPPEALRSKGYCALPKNTPLRYCLEALAKEQS